MRPQGEPLKGAFLEYIYAIRPDHKQPGYSIDRDHLHDGYAFASGPYDGWFAEFFLFRGEAGRDLVIERDSGYEIKGEKYGYAHSAFWFSKGKKEKVSLASVFPIKEMDRVFMRAKKKTGKGWKNFRLLQLPKEGLVASLELCAQERDPPFLTDVECMKVGTMTWDHVKFTVKELAKPEALIESI